ncbi:MAG: hypothetical protein QME40_02605, partial [bacterium]|nr:hypothetical protein [bacterium]
RNYFPEFLNKQKLIKAPGRNYEYCAHRLTADKREIKDFPKLPLETSFIRKTLAALVKPERRSLWLEGNNQRVSALTVEQ